MRITVRSSLVLIVSVGVLAGAAPVRAQVSAGPAAIVVFPRIVVDGSREVDTVVQLGNTSDTPLEVRCLYSDETPECVGTGACRPNVTDCDGTCMPRHTATPFRLRLTPHQPLGWSVASGLGALPLDGVGRTGPGGASNAGSVPPVTATPFEGFLHCVAVDDRGVPAERNALVGVASIERASGASVDAAQYNAIGLEANPGRNDGDEILQLGGQGAEYAACPQTLMLPHPLEGATVQAGTYVGTTSTTIALVPCGGNLLGGVAPSTAFQVFVRNEYGQRFSTARALEGQLVTELSLLDTTERDRSIFSAGVTGTLTGVSDFEGLDAGLLGVAVETQRSGSEPSHEHSAALVLATEGTRLAPAALALLRPPCPGDCNADGQVRIDELLLAINIALGATPVEQCLPADLDDSATVRINELTSAVQVALTSCPAPRAPTGLPDPEPTQRPTPVPPSLPGPDITFLGIASGDDIPQEPIGSDDQGREFFAWQVGQGFTIIVEARPGTNAFQVGREAAVPLGDTLPDLQMIVSRPLGDGSPIYCDADPPGLGGVPATDPFEFRSDADAVLAINDLGCRADDGFGNPRGRPGPSACTRLAPTGKVAPVADGTTAQFCVPIARAWAFPEGDTLVAARVRDTAGVIGPAKEIVIRIAAGP
jgi:hypothetical protein